MSSSSSNNNNQPPRQQQDWQTTMASRQQAEHQARLARIQQHRNQLLWEQLQHRKAMYMSDYELPLNYPAKVVNADDSGNGSLRTSSEFINARLLEAGLPLGSTNSASTSSRCGGAGNSTNTADGDSPASSNSSLAQHIISTQRFIRDLEGTGCYDSVQIHLGNHKKLSENKTHGTSEDNQQTASSNDIDVAVHLKEKKWYKLYIGGGVNSDDLSSLGGDTSSSPFGSLGSSSGSSGLSGVLPKLQFETSASLLNLTGFADVSSASYVVDQTGSTSFKFVHDRPLVSYLTKGSALHDWLMPQDPRTASSSLVDNGNANGKSNDNLDESTVYEIMDNAQYSLGGGSHTSLGLHATIHELDHESTRSYKEFVRSAGIRLANHSRGAARSSETPGSYKPSISPAEGMAGPYLYLDWKASLQDVLPKRSPTHPFALDCSPEIAQQLSASSAAAEAGGGLGSTYLKHTLTSGLYMNGCFVDDRYDPTMGYDAHLMGEVAGPPGDVGYCKVKCGYSWHMPVELMKLMALGVSDDEYNNDIQDSDEAGEKSDESTSSSVIGMALHSSLNCGLIRPLTFNGLLKSSNMVPSSDRFYIGGPGQLRGFMPAGIGPRSSASKGGSSVPGGDALGGDLFYTSTLAMSVPFPSYFATLRQNGARIFGFANAGTCCAINAGDNTSNILSGGVSSSYWNQILQSSRVSVGGGVSVGSPMGRFEATYAVPVRYGPRDARKSVQFGFGFSFG